MGATILPSTISQAKVRAVKYYRLVYFKWVYIQDKLQKTSVANDYIIAESISFLFISFARPDARFEFKFTEDL